MSDAEVTGSTPSTNASPKQWPGAFGIYGQSRDAIRRNIWLLVQMWVVYFAIVLVLSLVGRSQTLLVNIITTVIAVVFSVMLISVLLAGARGKQVKHNELFGDNLAMLSLKLLGLYLLVGLILTLSFLALIVPFFFVYPRLVLAPYYLIDQNLGVFDAISRSWNDTKGNAGKVWGIVGVMFLMYLLVFTIIGIPFAIYFLIMYGSAQPLLYLYVSESHPAPVA